MNCSDCKNTGTLIFASCCTYQGGVPDRWEPKPLTNYDRIISKTPEELAEFLCDGCCREGEAFPCSDVGCKKCWLDWLKQEVKE